MPLTAVHAGLGLVDATLDDLGCGARWADIHRVQPRAQLTCPGCSGAVGAWRSPKGLRYFRHDAKTPDCPHNGEGLDHHLLKTELAGVAREAGWVCALEVAGNGWRADVLATHPTTGRALAWEAQLAKIGIDDVLKRSRAMRADSVEVCWVSDSDTPWLAQAPSIRVARADDGALRIADGLARFEDRWCPERVEPYADGVRSCPGHGTWLPVDPLPLVTFAAALLVGTVRPHRLRARIPWEWAEGGRTVRWTTPAYVERESAQIAATAAAKAASRRDRKRRFPGSQAVRIQQDALAGVVAADIRRRTGREPVFGERSAAWAWGIPVLEGGRVRAVVSPLPDHVPAVVDRLASVVVYVLGCRERDVLAGHAAPGQQINVMNSYLRGQPRRSWGGGPPLPS